MDHETIEWSMEVDQNEDKENIDEEVIEDAELIESIIAKMSKLLINSYTPYKLKKILENGNHNKRSYWRSSKRILRKNIITISLILKLWTILFYILWFNVHPSNSPTSY